MPQVVTQQFLINAINAIEANVLTQSANHAKVHLAVAPFTPTTTSVPGDFTEATFTGYTAVTITGYGTAHIDPNLQGLVNITTPVLEWTPTGTTVQNDIVGYYITDGGGNLVAAEAFGTSYPMHSAANTLQFTAGVAAASYKFTTQVAP
jgi:Trk-type K+ transport system membrane component